MKSSKRECRVAAVKGLISLGDRGKRVLGEYLDSAEALDLLYKSCNNVNRKYDLKRTALHIAADNNYNKLASILIDFDANVDSIDIDNSTALHLASERSNFEIVKLLVENGANLNLLNDISKTPLYYAFYGYSYDPRNYSYDPRIPRLLIKSGADLHSKDGNGTTPVHCAASTYYLELIKFMVKSGADINIQDHNGNTPFEYSQTNEIFDYLRSLGAKKGSELNK